MKSLRYQQCTENTQRHHKGLKQIHKFLRFRFQRYLKIACAFLLLSSAQAFQDPSANQNDLLFDYMDHVSEKIGLERFESVSFEYIFAFARQLGQIERFNLTPELFMQNVENALAVRNHFMFSGHTMSDATFNAHILPLRIRYESTARPTWREDFRQELSPAVKGQPPSTAAQQILSKISETITLETNFSYDLGYRGDLDPLATSRGGYGDEVDLSILACASLRAVGIPARLAYTPHIEGANGGKVWLEFLDENESWQTWVPEFASNIPQPEHRNTLIDKLQGHCGVIFAHPADPIEITESYVQLRKVNFEKSPDEGVREQYNIAFFSGGFLRPIRGMELSSIRTKSPNRTTASQTFWSFCVQNDLAVQSKMKTKP